MLIRTNGRVNWTGDTLHRALWGAALAWAAWSIALGSAAAQTSGADPFLISSAPACVPGQVSVPLIEWDLPAEADFEPGAITVDVESDTSHSSRVWFVTRQGSARLFRFSPRPGRSDAPAQWKSWSLDPTAQPGGATTGGLKKVRPSKDTRNVFVRTPASLQQVDTQCKASLDPLKGEVCEQGLTVYLDRNDFTPGSSDLAIDDYNNVFTAAPPDLVAENETPSLEEYVQKLNPNAPVSNGLMKVTRWHVGGGAGLCPGPEDPSEFAPCLAGIDLDEKNQHLVYFSATNVNAIGELNTKLTGSTDNVRYWSLDALGQGVRGPRQLKVVREDGKSVVWVVTGSGHLVRLIPQSGGYALMSAHRMRDLENDPFGVAPDGDFIGYTSVADSPSGSVADPDRKDKVGMLLPKHKGISVPGQPRRVDPTYPTVIVKRSETRISTGTAEPDKKRAPGRVERNEQGDLLVDAFIDKAQPNTLPSRRPLGITPDRSSKVGTFFYAVGFAGDVVEPFAINRIGLAILPQAERPRHARDDDDFDGDGKKNRYEDDDDDDDGTPNHMDRDDDNDCRDDDVDDHDDDNDGHDDKWDDPRKKETRSSPTHTTAAGAFTDHQMVVPAGATLAIAQVTAADPAAPLKVEILGPTGVKLASPLPTPGVAVATVVPTTAGTYTVRVTNLGVSAINLTTDLIVQEAWPLVTSILP